MDSGACRVVAPGFVSFVSFVLFVVSRTLNLYFTTKFTKSTKKRRTRSATMPGPPHGISEPTFNLGCLYDTNSFPCSRLGMHMRLRYIAETENDTKFSELLVDYGD